MIARDGPGDSAGKLVSPSLRAIEPKFVSSSLNFYFKPRNIKISLIQAMNIEIDIPYTRLISFE